MKTLEEDYLLCDNCTALQKEYMIKCVQNKFGIKLRSEFIPPNYPGILYGHNIYLPTSEMKGIRPKKSMRIAIYWYCQGIKDVTF